MKKANRQTCVGNNVEELLEATGQRIAEAKADQVQVRTIWEEFCASARSYLDQAEREYRKAEDLRQSAAWAWDDAQDELEQLRRSMAEGESDTEFLNRYFDNELTGSDLARCWSNGWPVPERERISA